MIVKGRSRSDGGQLARYLLHSADNETVHILETAMGHDDMAEGIFASLAHFDQMAELTQGYKGHYHAQMSPDPRLRGEGQMSHDQWHEAAHILAIAHGLEHAPRVMVLHEKNKHTHAHVVFQRTFERDDGRFVFAPDSKNFEKNERAARKIEKTFGHELVKGAFHVDYDLEKDKPIERERGSPRPGYAVENDNVLGRTVDSQADLRRAEKSDKTKAEVKNELLALWNEHKDGKAFVQALENSGYVLAQGDIKPIHFVVDRHSTEAYDLVRHLDGVKKKPLTEKLKDYPASSLDKAADVRAKVREDQDRQREEGKREKQREAMQGHLEKMRLSQRRKPRAIEQKPRRTNDTRQGVAKAQQTPAGKRAQLKQAVSRMEKQWNGQKQDADHVQGWMVRAEREGIYERDAQTMAEQERIDTAGIEHARAEDEHYRLEQREVHINKARASLQSYHHAQRWAYGNETQSRRMAHGKMVREEYGQSLRRNKDELATLHMRQVSGGALYKLRYGRADRRRMEALTKEIETTQQRMDEANSGFARKEAERRQGFDKGLQRESEALDRQTRNMSRLPSYLDPERQPQGWEADLERSLRPANDQSQGHEYERDRGRHRRREPEPRPKPPNMRRGGGF